MKRAITIILFALLATLSAQAQLYVPGETLNYRMSYKAKFFPNTEVAKVVMQTTEAMLDGMPVYKVYGYGETAKAFSWVLPVQDAYTIWIDPETLRTKRFDSDLHEGDYTFRSTYLFDWKNLNVHTRWQSRQRPERYKTMKISDQSMDAVSLYFNLRSIDASTLSVGQTHNLEMVLEDTVKVLKYRLLGREVCRVPQQGKFRTIKLACTLGTSEGFSFTDGSEFFIWITDDKNKFPVMLESPIKIGSIRAYISDFKGLKYPLDCKVK